MSAIFGILRFDGEAVNARELERMANAMAHRMPDGRKFVIEGAIGLGHGLMRVNQEDFFEAQPLHDRDASLTLVADCRIDNREELAAAFGWSDAECCDKPDSAFVLAAYKKWGENCAAHLLGDFAFAIWDGRANKLFLARDHIGQRFVHYHHGKDLFVFATEPKALWAVQGVPRAYWEVAVAKHLMQDTLKSPGSTLFAGVLGVPGGYTLCVAANGSSERRPYWDPHPAPEHLGHDEAYYAARYRSVLEEAVACRLRRLTRPAALCLSGGFDSGAIAALAGPVVTAQGRKLIAAASVMAEGEMARGDARAAVEACRRIMPHLDVRYYVRAPEETSISDLELSFWSTDSVAGNNYVYRGLFAIAAASGARLVMDGHGGDYTLNYRGYIVWRSWLSKGQFGRALREFRAHARVHRRSAWQTLRYEVLPVLLPALVVDGLRSLQRRGTPIWRTRAVAEAFALRMFAEGQVDPKRIRGKAAGALSGRAWCLRVLETQRGRPRPGYSLLAASHGLDQSSPFHDKRVVELGLAVPEVLYVKQGRDRYLARRAFAGLLPQALLARVGPNDSHDPDYEEMIRAAAPLAMAESRRLAADPRVTRLVDLAAVERAFARARDVPAKIDRPRVSAALSALIAARFVAWFEKGNA